jgi:2-oxoglutarate ferredoxin oxidoreductase subunit alpha
MILGDGVLGQMMEPVAFSEAKPQAVDKPWATTGRRGREKNIVNSLYLDPAQLEEHNRHLQAKYQRMKEAEVRFDTYCMEDARLVIVAYGISARIARTAIEMARADGIAAGLLRPITLFPFPEDAISQVAQGTEAFLALEMSAGQMVEDVRLAVNGRKPVYFYGRTGGIVPTPQEVYLEIKRLAGEEVAK